MRHRPGPEYITRVELLSPETWTRASRGSSFEFSATDEDIVELLTDGVPQVYRPLSICGEAYDERRADEKCFVFDVDPASVNEWLSFDGGHRANTACVRSHPLSGETLPDWTAPRFVAGCVVSGFVMIQHGDRRSDGRREASRIAICPRAINEATGEIVQHPEHEVLFRRMKSWMKHVAIVQTVWPIDGRKGHPMTVRARDAVSRGVQYVDEPIA